MAGQPRQAGGDPGTAFQRQGRARQADGAGGQRGRQVRVGAGGRQGRPRARRRQDDLLHLSPVVDDELRRLPFADRGELENQDAPFRG